MIPNPRSRARTVALGALGTLLASAAVATPGMAAEPPAPGHEVISFPQRDFVSASGYAQGVPAYVQVIRGGVVVATSDPVMPEDDLSTTVFDGIVEVNHAGGGGCWNTVTPDIRPGDKVRVYQDDPADPAAATQINDDTTTTAAVTTGLPVVTGTVTLASGATRATVEVKGTAKDLVTGAPLPLAQLEQRLINGDKFATNGRRDLRAPGNGTLTYDAGAGNINWTARYTVRTADVAKVRAAESRILWLGKNPAAGTELTIFEAGAEVVGGPEAPCSAPLEGTSTVVRTPVAPDPALAPAATTVGAPQGTHALTAFPSRDFVSAEGYAPGSIVSFSVYRGTTLVGQSENVTVGADGIAEVNHPGGGCWLADTQTPNIRPGDRVRITSGGVAEETVVANVTAGKPVQLSPTSVRVTGTAFKADGTPMVELFEQRLVNPERFASGRRTLRAPGEGSLTFDGTGGYTATYANLTAADVSKALRAESRALWLGPDGLGSQMTIFEAEDPAGGIVNGPQAPCVAPAEVG